MSKRALIVLAEGFEEVEAVSVIDVLRRAQVKVTISAIDFKLVTGAHNLMIKADCLLETLPDYDFDMLVLPGGEPGTTNLENSTEVQQLIKKFDAEGKFIAAICNAPRILDRMGLLDGKKATSYPAAEGDMKHCSYSNDPVVVDGRIVTSRGPATALAFAYELVGLLKSVDAANELKKGMLFSAAVPA